MEIGDLVYPILAIAITAISALNKKKKRVSNSEAPKRNVFEEIFSQEETYDDPVLAQAEYESQRNIVAEEPEMDEASEYASQGANIHTPVVSEPVKPKVKKPSVNEHSNHNPIGDLRSPDELRRAFIYSEILKTKF